ncbi:MAG: hypothetical protein O2931_14140, partial [Planctomycetota bacterium]|nr:hypothetical protein [Planctomycetota bacterium]
MKQNATHIPVRPRSFAELLDLSLHVMVRHLAALTWICLIFVGPFLAFDLYLCHTVIAAESLGEGGTVFLILPQLVFLQAPLATSAVTLYMGRVMFLQQTNPRTIVSELWRVSGTLILIHGISRLALVGTGVALAGCLSSAPDAYFGFLSIMTFFVAIVRGLRPFVNELVLLERCTLRSRANSENSTVSHRNRSLHASNSGTIAWRSFISIPAAILLLHIVNSSGSYVMSQMVGRQIANPYILAIWMSLCFWFVAVIFSIVRFLNYLDIRIRNEGWDVQLLVLT